MSGPVLDIEVLRKEYGDAAEGWEWLVDEGTAYLVDRKVYQGRDGYCVWVSRQGRLVVPSQDVPPRVAITVACAYLGIPTPWRAAELLETSEYLPNYTEHYNLGRSAARGDAARMLRGEPEVKS